MSENKKTVDKSRINKNRIKPDVNIPDIIEVPDKTIMLLTNSDNFIEPYQDIMYTSEKQRPWFGEHFYFCLPLSMGNQHGFIVNSLYDVLIRWNGRNDTSGLSVIVNPDNGTNTDTLQIFNSHFGYGVVTMQMQYTMRTPKGVNILLKEPPNYPLPTGLSAMNAVVETDQLRRDFTFNFKVTEPNIDIFIPKGTPLASLVPYPRFFHDGYKIDVTTNENYLKNYRDANTYYTKEREIEYNDGGKPSLRYMGGEDIFGNMFDEHQKSLDGGKWWSNVKRKRKQD